MQAFILIFKIAFKAMTKKKNPKHIDNDDKNPYIIKENKRKNIEEAFEKVKNTTKKKKKKDLSSK